MRGQITIINLIGLFIALVLYFALLPALNAIADQAVADISVTPNQFTSLTITLIYAIPFFILVAIVLTAMNYAIPGRYGVASK